MFVRTGARGAAVVALVLLACSTTGVAADPPFVPPSSDPRTTLLTSVWDGPDTTLGAPSGSDSASAASDTTSSPPAPTREPAERGVTDRAKRAVGNFLSDGWVIVSSPFRARGAGLLLMAGVIGAEAVLYANDQEILDATIRNREDPVFKAVVDVGKTVEPVGLMGRTNPIYLGALGMGYLFNVRLLRTIPTEILESHLLAGGVRNVAKAVVGRAHPYENVGPYTFDFGHGTSFPSGHTSVVYELATIAYMNTHSLPVGIVGYSVATAAAVQRIESRNHWASDVLISAVYGTLIARTVVRLHEERESKGTQGMFIHPDVSSDGRLMGVRVTRRF
jgi:membrane-associated phospholipid phosphatase